MVIKYLSPICTNFNALKYDIMDLGHGTYPCEGKGGALVSQIHNKLEIENVCLCVCPGGNLAHLRMSIETLTQVDHTYLVGMWVV